MGLATWTPIMLLCYTPKFFNTTSRTVGNVGTIFGMCWVAIDYKTRIKWLAYYLAPKALEVLFALCVYRRIISNKIVELIPELIKMISFGLLAMAVGIDKDKPII